MDDRYRPIDLEGLKTYPLSDRKSKVSAADFAAPWKKGETMAGFLDRLPNLLAADDLRSVIEAVSRAFREHRTIIFAMGAHVIKVGLNPVVIDLMERGVITGVAMNGAGIIHDLEIAMSGKTSEEVTDTLGDGSFGMARETGLFLSEAIRSAGEASMGLGRAVGKKILETGLPLADRSILAAGARLHIPVTVHVAIGTDILHMHPDFDAAAAGAASHLDFRILANLVSTLEAGVFLNVGSAVVLPEVFLKTLTLARNLGHRVDRFTTVNMDFIRHYRPMTNVVCRPTAGGGKGINLIGHHEIMLPLIAAGIIETVE
jgi:hypothetical protein